MSPIARHVVGVVLLLSAMSFFLIGASLGPQLPAGAWPFFGLAAFCAVGGVACYSRSTRPLTLRIIGAGIAAAYVWYLIAAWGRGNMDAAITGFLVWGLPAGYLAISGKYPSWGHGAEAFAGDNTDADHATVSQPDPIDAPPHGTWDESQFEQRGESWINAETARSWGICMLAIGLIGVVLSLFGVGFRGKGPAVTLAAAGCVMAVGLIALIASMSPQLTNLVRLGARSVLGLVLLVLVLLVLAVPVMIVFFLLH